MTNRQKQLSGPGEMCGEFGRLIETSVFTIRHLIEGTLRVLYAQHIDSSQATRLEENLLLHWELITDIGFISAAWCSGPPA